MNEQRKTIAVIGSGISGLSAAWRLAETHDVTVFEADSRPGGHAHTVDTAIDGQPVSVDTGFIVYNELNYPNFTPMLDHLGVETAASDMSFAASLNNGGFEYAGSGLTSLFAQKRNLLRPRMWRMLSDIIRLYRNAEQESERARNQTLDEFLSERGFSREFRDDHILPMCAAIWSSPAATMADYPARTFFDFFTNHGLLNFSDRPAWRTIRNGSRNYVDALLKAFKGTLECNHPITSVRRGTGQVTLHFADHPARTFDDVVFACHSDQALRLIENPTETESQLLGAIRYQPNTAWLHTDTRLMPRRRSVWSSWNYISQTVADDPQDKISLTYWMNRLQPLPTETPVLVTLNPDIEPAANTVLQVDEYDHPVYTPDAVAAQEQIWTIQGENHTWFAGAWLGYGFHEDGLQAGLAVAEALGAPVRPWGLDNCLTRIHWPGHIPSAETRSPHLREAAE